LKFIFQKAKVIPNSNVTRIQNPKQNNFGHS
jgi:hypothetical protein